jgi:hypothetical protein
MKQKRLSEPDQVPQQVQQRPYHQILQQFERGKPSASQEQPEAPGVHKEAPEKRKQKGPVIDLGPELNELKLGGRDGGGSGGPGPGEGSRRSSGKVTRVVGDLLVFAEVQGNGGPLGLGFKPNKIVGYRGQPLNQLGIRYEATIPEITWDPVTRKVLSVRLRGRPETPPMFTSL